MEFEWDEKKRHATLRKHGIDFVAAARVFSSPHVLHPARSDFEPRMIAVGDVDGVTIAVIFTIRNKNIRIITARRARRHEREDYGALFARGNQPTRGPH